MRKSLLIVLAIAACGDEEPEPLCTTKATTYKSAVVYCTDRDDAICTEDVSPGGPVLCRQLCSDTGPACGDGLIYKTTLVTKADGSVGSICYCEPPPGAVDRDYLGTHP